MSPDHCKIKGHGDLASRLIMRGLTNDGKGNGSYYLVEGLAFLSGLIIYWG